MREPSRTIGADISGFIQAYFDAAFFFSMDESNEQGGEPLNKRYTVVDLAPETGQKMVEDCETFLANCKPLLVDENLTYAEPWDAEQLGGHDFWLTRNGHGAGFWDGDWNKEAGERLTQVAEALGTFELYVGDDGRIYGSSQR
jgi:hypothetical protein